MDRILVIDDELELCEILKEVLEKAGYSVSIAVSSREGLNLVKKAVPDLIMCDMIMEGMDGVEFLAKIKEEKKDIPFIIMSAYGSYDKVVQALELGAQDFIAKPFRPNVVIDLVKKVLKTSKASAEKREKMIKSEMSPIRRILRDSYMSILKSFAIILESKDPYIREHSMRVTKYAVMLAKEIGLHHDEIEIIENTAYFHDIGKVGISDTILQKPDKLTEDEWVDMKRHPEIGYEIIEPLKVLHIALPGVRHHHERFDGKGYPDGLSGENIPLSARILTIADSYEALTANRPYRKAKSTTEAVAELKRCSGSQFDPKLVEVFIKVLKKAGEV
jgi:putative nucleotidyltransferase with HDIG domain